MSLRLPRGIRRLFRLGQVSPQVERDVDDELRFHFEEAVRALTERGLSEADARREAESQFGDTDAYRDRLARIDESRVRREKRLQAFDFLRQSARSLVRSSRRQPVLTAGVIATFAVGIGANATMYGIVDRILLRAPDHIAEPERVRLVRMERPLGRSGGTFVAAAHSYADYEALKAHAGLRVAAVLGEVTEEHVGRGGSASIARVSAASAELFSLLGVDPHRGRFFTASEAMPGAAMTAVVSAEYWTRVYGADPAVLGRIVEIAGVPHTMLGVAPFRFTGVDVRAVDFWVPLEATLANSSIPCGGYGCTMLRIVARLGPGTSDEAAEAQATSLVSRARREAARPGVSDQVAVLLGSIIAAREPEASPESRLALWLGGVSLIVLLIACANVANLLAARGVRQQREVAVRLALGARRGGVVMQAVVESLLLALTGGLVALGLARWGGGIIRSTLLPDVYFPDGGVSWRLLGFALVLAAIAGLAAAAGPALQLRRPRLTHALHDATAASSRGRSRLGTALTNAQAALSVVLLVGAGLFVRSVQEERAIDLGIDDDRLLYAGLTFRDPELGWGERLELYREAIERLESLPQVRAAASTRAPFGTGSVDVSLRVPGIDSIPELPGGGPFMRRVSEGYFETTGIEILRGRSFADAADPPEAVVSETMARALWPGRNAVGECLWLDRSTDCTRIVGVAEDAAQERLSSEPFMAYYVRQEEAGMLDAIYVRAEGDVGAAREAVSLALRTYSPAVRGARVETLRDWLDVLDPTARSWRVGAVLLSLFGILAMTLVGIGLYAVLAFDVAQRTREIGIRSALGAGLGRLLGGVLLSGGRLTGAGVLLGLLAAYLVAPYGRDLLFRVSPRDPGVLAGVAVLLALVTLAGAFVPGLRAARADPTISLRAD